MLQKLVKTLISVFMHMLSNKAHNMVILGFNRVICGLLLQLLLSGH